MPQSTHTVRIDLPPSQVFDFLADPENDTKWRESIRSMRKVSGSGVGSIFEQRVAGPGGRSIAADIEITELEAPSLISFKTVAGPVRPVGSYQLKPVDSGTEVTLSLSVELTGLRKVMSGAVQKSMDAETSNLRALKDYLETLQSDSPTGDH